MEGLNMCRFCEIKHELGVIKAEMAKAKSSPLTFGEYFRVKVLQADTAGYEV